MQPKMKIKAMNRNKTYLMTNLTSYISFLIAPSLNTFPMSKLDEKEMSAQYKSRK